MKTEKFDYHDLRSRAYMGHIVRDTNGNRLTHNKLRELAECEKSNSEQNTLLNVAIIALSDNTYLYQIIK